MGFTHVMLIVVFGVLGSLAVDSTFNCRETVPCDSAGKYTQSPLIQKSKCTSQWGAFPRMEVETNKMIMHQLTSSFHYLLLANQFNNWNTNRPGFVNYFNKLSDDNWNEALSLMTHMTERGGKLSETFSASIAGIDQQNLREIEALTLALDMERTTAFEMTHLAHSAIHGNEGPHDAEFGEFLAQRLHSNSVLRIKHLANYVNLLTDFLQDTNVDAGYALFKFDSEYLK